jgi:hypothetical protein
VSGPAAAPPAWSLTPLNFDAHRGFTVAGPQYINSFSPYATSTLNGGAWTTFPGFTPERGFAGSGYDTVRRRVTIFGCCRGVLADFATDTWAFEGTQWTQVLPNFPGLEWFERPVPAFMAFDSTRRAMVMIGQAFTNPFFPHMETYEYRYLDAVMIDRQPAGISPPPGTTARLRVLAAGAPTLGYQWRRDGAPLADGPTGAGSVISGSSTAELVISNFRYSDLGDYTCAVTNACGTVVTAEAAVGCAADWNDDGQVNSSDISGFLTAWVAALGGGDAVADFNGDGLVNSTDISAFLTGWLAAVTGGC